MSGWGSPGVGVGGAVEDWRSALFPRLVRLQFIRVVTILIITILTVTILIITVFIITIPTITITILIILIITILVTILSSLTREKFDNEIAIATRS